MSIDTAIDTTFGASIASVASVFAVATVFSIGAVIRLSTILFQSGNNIDAAKADKIAERKYYEYVYAVGHAKNLAYYSASMEDDDNCSCTSGVKARMEADKAKMVSDKAKMAAIKARMVADKANKIYDRANMVDFQKWMVAYGWP